MNSLAAERVISILQLVFGAHACIDALHVLCALFPLCMALYLGEERTLKMADLYVSFFNVNFNSLGSPPADCASSPSTPIDTSRQCLFRRAIAYWVAAMSLVRLTTALSPVPVALIATAFMYFLEALSFEFEGYSACTVKPQKARTISLVNTFIGLVIIFVVVR